MPSKLSVFRQVCNRLDLTWVEALSLVTFVALLAAAIRASAPAGPSGPPAVTRAVVLAARR